MVRPPLAKGDDGSGNRYPVRAPEGIELIGWHGLRDGEIVCTYGDVHFANAGLQHGEVDTVVPVPASFFASTPESFDLPCDDDDEPYPGRFGHLCGGQARCTCP